MIPDGKQIMEPISALEELYVAVKRLSMIDEWCDGGYVRSREQRILKQLYMSAIEDIVEIYNRINAAPEPDPEW